MRESTDEIKNQAVWNGFDYNLQVWVKNGVCQTVGAGSDQYCGRLIKEVEGHQVKGEEIIQW